ncbi:hypothetical protein GOBAR_DD14158 [Gossypium barbadense]|nr:hypothetical protein GOBAR_DD14158 [Gossypium barbadense]
MKVVAAYLLAVLGGNASPSADDLKVILGSVGAEADDDRIELLLSEVKGKDITELIASGREKLASVPSGGGAVAVAAPAAGGGGGDAAPAAEAKKEEKVEEKEESDDVISIWVSASSTKQAKQISRLFRVPCIYDNTVAICRWFDNSMAGWVISGFGNFWLLAMLELKPVKLLVSSSTLTNGKFNTPLFSSIGLSYPVPTLVTCSGCFTFEIEAMFFIAFEKLKVLFHRKSFWDQNCGGKVFFTPKLLTLFF